MFQYCTNKKLRKCFQIQFPSTNKQNNIALHPSRQKRISQFHFDRFGQIKRTAMTETTERERGRRNADKRKDAGGNTALLCRCHFALNIAPGAEKGPTGCFNPPPEKGKNGKDGRFDLATGSGP